MKVRKILEHLKHQLTQLCNPTAGSKVPGFQRCGSVPVCGLGKVLLEIIDKSWE
jgi:hypothetical protein